jgi:hypothetical protein
MSGAEMKGRTFDGQLAGKRSINVFRMIFAVLMVMTLAGCGEIDWFPESTSTTSSGGSGTVTASTPIVSGTTSDNLNTSVSVKVDVTNTNTVARSVSVLVVGRDVNGIQVSTITLSGTVDPSSTKSLTNSLTLLSTVFATITKWEVSSINAT